MPLPFHPGDQWEYGMSTDVLGRVVEVVSGKTLDQFIDQEICQPLGMHDTFFTIPAEKRSRLVAAYASTKDGIVQYKDGDLSPDLVSGDYPYNPKHVYLSRGRWTLLDCF